MQRPFGIQVATLLMACALVMDQTVSFTFTLPPAFPGQLTAFQTQWMGVVSLIMNLIAAAFVLAFWNGMSWSRWAVMIDSFCLIVELHKLPMLWDWSHSMAVLSMYKAAVGVYLLVYLNLRSTREWFATRTQLYRQKVRPAKGRS